MIKYYLRVTGLSFLICLLLCLAASAQTPVSFSGPLAYLGNSPAIGDFNGDGIPDLATIDQTSNIYIHSGVGNGTFEGDRIIDLSMANGGAIIYNLVAADVNVDGLPDLILSSTGPRGRPIIFTLLGKAGGGFEAPVAFEDPEGLTTLYIADVNSDGKPDLILVSSISASIALGNGDGSFQPSLLAFSQAIPSATLAFADFNGDGNLDLAIPVTNGIFILFGDGAGHFPTGTTFTIDEQLGPIAAADVNGDGKQDLIAEGIQLGFVEIYLGDGQGGFRNPTVYFIGRSGGYGASGLAIGDVNGDGVPDIVTPDPAVLLGKGDGTFGTPLLFQINRYWTTVQLVDLTQAGPLDIVGSVAVGTAEFSTTVILNDGTGQFQSGQTVQLNGPLASCMAVADFYQDGHDDAAVGLGSNVAILLGTGQAKAALRPASLISLPSRYGACPLAADVNHDGIPDLLVNQGRGGFSFLKGLGSGTFASPVVTAQELGNLVIGDFNRDGMLDVAGIVGADIKILTGNGTGTFSPYALVSTPSSNLALAAADLNGDGLSDLIAVTRNSEPNDLLVYLNAGGGTFTSQVIPLPPAPFSPEFIVVADLNKDGIPDLIVIGTAQSYIFLGQGAGVFTQSSELPAGGMTGSVADINGDGLPDLVISDDYVAKVFLGNGLGSFSFPENPDGMWYAPANPTSIAPAFLQSQSPTSGFADLLTVGASTQGATVTVLINRSASQ